MRFPFLSRLGLAWLLLCLPAAVWAASAPRRSAADLDISYWSVENGLPAESVTSIQQTREGFLWIGTVRGLARFDGRDFTRVFSGAGTNASVIGGLHVTAECVDASNRLWFGTKGEGIFRIDPELPLPIEAEGMGLEEETINCLGADKEGGVWIGTERGLLHWKKGEFQRTELEPGVREPGVLGLQVTRSNGVWVTTSAGLRRIEGGRMQPSALGKEADGGLRGMFEDREGSLWSFGDTYLLNVPENRRFNYFRGGGATQLQVWSIAEGRPGQLWIGTRGQGLFHFGGSRFYAVDLREGRDYSDVRSVFVDQDGQIWVGTQMGLLRLRERMVRWFGVEAGVATSVVEDAEGRVWAGFEHGGLYLERGGVLEPAGEAVPESSQNLISSIYMRPDLSLWMGTVGKGLLHIKQGRVQRFSAADRLSDESVVAVAGGLSGRVVVSTADGKLHRFLEVLQRTFDERDGLTGNSITAIIRASEGGFWLGTSAGEVLRFQDEKGQLLPLASEFAGKRVSALKEDAEKRLWVGTAGGGLGCFAAGKWKNWTTEQGLPDNTVWGIEGPTEGDLWVATRHGVCKLPASWGSARPQHLAVLVDFPEGGTKSAAFGWPRSAQSRDGALWFATDAGVVSFHPAELEFSARPNAVRIEGLRANGMAMQLPANTGKQGELRLPAGLHELQIRFTTPRPGFPEKVRFRHKLEGFDPYWVDSSETRVAQYGRLPGGEYRFRVQCSDIESRWTGPETVLVMTVATAFWRTPGGLGTEAVVLVGAVALVVRGVSHRRLKRQLERAEQQRGMERERSRIAQDMHDELGAKLTKISFMSERARNDLAGPAVAVASAKLDSIASTSRELLHSLDEIVWAVNPRNDTLESLAAYLGQYASEYLQNTNVEFELRMPGPLPDAALSAEVRHNLFLAFEEALGNALKHAEASRVRVSMSLVEKSFRVVVEDDGRGLRTAPGGPGSPGVKRAGMGLEGMRERLQKSGGSFEVSSASGKGTTVVLSIPVKIAGAKRANQAEPERSEKAQ